MENNDLIKAMQKMDVEKQKHIKQSSMKKEITHTMIQTINGLKKENDSLRSTMELMAKNHQKCEKELLEKTADCIRLKQLIMDMTNNQNEEKNDLFFRIFECIDCYEKEKNQSKKVEKDKKDVTNKVVQVNTRRKARATYYDGGSVRWAHKKRPMVKRRRKIIPVRRRKLNVPVKCAKRKQFIPKRRRKVQDKTTNTAHVLLIRRKIKEFGEHDSDSVAKQSSLSRSSLSRSSSQDINARDAESGEAEKAGKIAENEEEVQAAVMQLKNEDKLNESEEEIGETDATIIKYLNESLDLMKMYHLSHIKTLRKKLTKKQDRTEHESGENVLNAVQSEVDADNFD